MRAVKQNTGGINKQQITGTFTLATMQALDGPFLVTDVQALARKLTQPTGVLKIVWSRFKDRLTSDAAFRRDNLFLLALLPDTPKETLEEIAQLVRTLAADLGSANPQDDRINNHTWCAAPFALRTAAYATWLVHAGQWQTDDLVEVGHHLLGFCEQHAQNVLRTRVPTSDNQSMSLALTCTAVGHAFSRCEELRERAMRLRDENFHRLIAVLQLADEDGYLCEGSTYQSHVVTPLAMWAAAMLQQMFGSDVLSNTWQPGGSSLLAILNFESRLWGPGHQQPGWDNHGWEPQANLAGIAAHAKATRQPAALQRALDVWDRDTYIAWCEDDRLWTLLYWPNEEVIEHKPTGLSGWSSPHTAATLDDYDRVSRLMLCFDRCAEALLSVSRNQTNPNHLLFEINGMPIFGDGKRCDKTTLNLQPADIRPWLEPGQIPILTQQHGSVENWARRQEEGFVGAANCIIIDHEETYFNAQGSRGQLVFEQRQPDRHIVSADARAFYQPRYDLSRATRAIASSSQGPYWIVDQLFAAASHVFTWNLYLRNGCTLHSNNSLSLTTSDNTRLSMAWLPVETQSLTLVPNYPDATVSRCNTWPEHGSQRLQLTNSGSEAQFVVCMLPGIACDMRLESLGKFKWRAMWQDENAKTCEHVFELPEAALAGGNLEPTPALTWDDLDETPATISDEVAANPFSFLKSPATKDWRQTIGAMQAVVQKMRHGQREEMVAGLPLIHALLVDTKQGYQVHSVAAWSLGAALYAPAADDLASRMHSIEPNLKHRACWAYQRITAQTPAN